MPETADTTKKWWVKGLLFENCNCQIVCQGHISFRQLCSHERCFGHWSIHIDEGEFEGATLNDLNVIILYDTPQQMSTVRLDRDAFTSTSGRMRRNAKLSNVF